MADRLCAPKDLASLLERDLDAYKTIMLIECGTAVVQEAAGNQRIVRVVDAAGEQMGTTDAWLDLPQRPVSAISHVQIDGGGDLVAGTDFKRFGSRLWRRCGWARLWPEPSTITYTWTHGYDVSDEDSTNWPQETQLARGAVIGLIRSLFDNETGAVRVAIDDYSAAYDAMSVAMAANDNLQAALRRRYGVPAGVVRLG